MARNKIFWLHRAQPIVPKNRVEDDEIVLTGIQLAKVLNRSQSNIYYRMRSRKLKELGVKRYFRFKGRWYYLVNRSLASKLNV